MKFYMLWNHRCLKNYHREVKTLEDWKIKIAVLWSVLEFCMITLSTVENYLLYIEEMIADTTPELMMVLVIAFLIPPLMAFLSLTLKDSINRWLNIIVVIVFIIILPIGSANFFTEPIITDYLPSIIIILIVQIVALALVVWYAWKSKQKA